MESESGEGQRVREEEDEGDRETSGVRGIEGVSERESGSEGMRESVSEGDRREGERERRRGEIFQSS